MNSITFSNINNKQEKGTSLIVNNQLSNEIFDNLPVAVYTCDTYGYITSYNKAAKKLWGRAPELGKDLWCGSWKIFQTTGEPLPLDTCPMARTLKEGIAIEGEVIIVEHPDGTRRIVEPYPAPLFDSNGILNGAINTLIDITEKRNSETKDAMLASIIESSDDAIISKNLNGDIATWNSAAKKLFGYSEAEILGKSVTLLIPLNRLQEEQLIVSKIKNNEKVEHYETCRLTKSGLEIPVSLTISPIKDIEGNIIGASKIARDISKQKIAEQKLQTYAKNLEVLNSIGKIISENLNIEEILQKVTDATTILTGAKIGSFFYNTINENGEASMLYTLSGAPKEAFERFGMPKSVAIFHPTFAGEGVIRVDDINKDSKYIKNYLPYKMLEGHLPVVSYLSVLVISKARIVIGGLFFGHPEAGKFTTEHERLVVGVASQASIALDNAKLYEEIKILNAKKDEFIGLASHELKTPLTSISGYLQILERTQTEEKSKKFVLKTIHQVKKLTPLVSDLLDVSKIEASQLQLIKEQFDFMEVLNDAIELIQDSSPSNHEISVEINSNNLQIYGDRLRIEQVIINLLTNAIKYSPFGGKIELSLAHVNDEIKLGVKDSGIGIPNDKLNQIFSRFYRVEGLNPHMSGLGIGLYISKEIIERHNGKIWVESELGQGSIFWVTLPNSSTTF